MKTPQFTPLKTLLGKDQLAKLERKCLPKPPAPVIPNHAKIRPEERRKLNSWEMPVD